MAEGSPGRLTPALIACVLGYMSLFGVKALRQGNTEFMIYTGAMVVFIAIALALHRGLGLRSGTLWMLALWGGLHMAGGTIPIDPAWSDMGGRVLYGWRPFDGLPRYDQVVHTLGFFAATLACHDVLAGLTRWSPRRPRLGLAVCAALMGVGLGALNEVLEFGITLVVPDHGVGGYVNTGWDLVSNTLGAALATVRILTRRFGRA